MSTATNACGSCTLCCKVLGIAELAKPRDAWCPRCAPGKGCREYGARPPSCSGYSCVWLATRNGVGRPMEDGLRPDRCKVVLDPTTDGRGMVAHVDRGSPHAWRRPAVHDLLMSFVRDGRPVIVAVGDRRIWLDAERGEVVVPTDMKDGTETAVLPD